MHPVTKSQNIVLICEADIPPLYFRYRHTRMPSFKSIKSDTKWLEMITTKAEQSKVNHFHWKKDRPFYLYNYCWCKFLNDLAYHSKKAWNRITSKMALGEFIAWLKSIWKWPSLKIGYELSKDEKSMSGVLIMSITGSGIFSWKKDNYVIQYVNVSNPN